MEIGMNDNEQRILIKGGRVYRHEGDTDSPAVADILIDGTRITAIDADLESSMEAARQVDRVIDAHDKLVIPGFVNAHYHSHDTLLKGCFETIPLEVWVLSALPPAYPPRSKEEARARTLLGAAECIRSGMTTVQDMLTIYPFDEGLLDTVLDAYDEVGIRTVFSLQVADIPGAERTPFWREVVPAEYQRRLSTSSEPLENADPVDVVTEQYQRLRDAKPRIGWALAPAAPEFCSLTMLERLADLSQRHDLPVFTHIYESKVMAVSGRQFFPEHGGSQVKFLRAAGLTGPRLSLAHSIWMLPEEIEILAETKTNVVLNPVGNLKTKSGVPPIRRYLEAGVNTALGCDNCSCSDAQNMFQAMKMFGGLAAISHTEPGPPDATDCIRAATLAGATALGKQDEIGALEPGRKADLTILDLAELSFVPFNSAARQLVYSEGGSAVRTVVVDGNVVMEDRRLTTINEGELRDAVDVVMEQLSREIDETKSRVAEIYPYILEAWRRSWKEDVGLNRFVGDGTG
jgi:guanine deaminase